MLADPQRHQRHALCRHAQEYFKKLGLPDEVAELLARKGAYDSFPLDAEAVTAVRSACLSR